MKPQDAVELVIAVDPAAHRWTYRSHGTGPLFRAERAFAVSQSEDGGSRFEVRDVVGGVIARPAGWWLGDKVKVAQEEMAKALKARVEGAAV